MADFFQKIANFSFKKLALLTMDLKSKLETIEHAREEPIAVVGLACRFPGNANNLESFWKLLREGVDAITEVPSNRWDIDAYYDPDPEAPGKMCTRWGSFLRQEEVEEFDPEFFGISHTQKDA